MSRRSKSYKGLAHDIIRSKDPSFNLHHLALLMMKDTCPSYFKVNRKIKIFLTSYHDGHRCLTCYNKICIDSTQIDACIVLEADQMHYRGRKGIITFKVMASCDLDMCFTFLPVGWEGSARVFLHAINTPTSNFSITVYTF